MSDPYWYKDAVIYEVNVRAFADSNGDGVGDFAGLTSKLDYLKDLGVTALWLLPFYPSPLRDDGYDISDYTDVSPIYGTLADFQKFLAEAHKRGLRVITELVLNHTSDRHPWFQRARRAAPGSPERDFYVWTEEPRRYSDARIIFKDFEHSNWTWDPAAKAYYWHRFYHHQPDLNYDNPAVRETMLKVVDFWLDMGIDGLRLDAVPYLFEREGTNCENLPETHAYLKQLRAHVEARHGVRLLLAEANQWPEDASAYFGAGEGDECNASFHFPLMPRLFMALQTEDRFPIVDILDQTPPLPASGQWVLFLRNHDELTLEMVTDEERDYMYRVYASDPQARINLGIRRRLAPLLSKHRRRIELMNGLLFSLPGTPVIYYGDEIGMGDNFYLGDRNGVRTPMQWSADRNAGFSQGPAQRLFLPVIIDPEYHYEAVNVEVQQNNPQSLLWWMKRFIAHRKRFKSFGRGALEMLQPENRKVLAFIRSYEDEEVLVVANLSRFVQHVELPMSGHAGRVPVEVFGRSEFPPIGEAPYPLTLGPHEFFWFSLRATKPAAEAAQTEEEGVLERIRLIEARAGRPTPVFLGAPSVIPAGPQSFLVLVPAEGGGGEARPFIVRLARRGAAGEALIARLPGGAELSDAALDPEFAAALSRNGDEFSAPGGLPGGPAEGALQADGTALISYGREATLRMLWRAETGESPALELGRFLAKKGYQNAVEAKGALKVRGLTVGVFTGWTPPESSAWRQALDSLGRYFEAASAAGGEPSAARAKELIGPYFSDVELLGRRVAELHLALASEPDDPAFSPEPFSTLYQRALYQSLRTLTREVAHQLKKRLRDLPPESRAAAETVLAMEEETLKRFRAIHEKRLSAARIRCHGDLRLTNVSYTGKDYLFTGFEGDLSRPLSERRIKRSALRDLAALCRSFHHAAQAALSGRFSVVRPEDRGPLQAWAFYWEADVVDALIGSYLSTAGKASFIPASPDELRIMLDTYLREAAVRELGAALQSAKAGPILPLLETVVKR